MSKELIIIIEDPYDENPEHYLDLLWEDLQELLESRDLKLKDIKERLE